MSAKRSQFALGLSRRIMRLLFGPTVSRHFAVRYWDGSEEQPSADGDVAFTLVLRHSGALRRMLLPPSELSAADTALQSSISAVQSAISLAAEGASTTATAETRANLATQVQGIQQTLVSLSQTQVGNTYIFSGDQSSQPSYQLDPTQPEGVKQLQTSTSTRVIQDVNGTAIATARTAQQIFDPQDATGNPTAGNTFAAINSLLTALNNNDTAGITTAAASLKSSSDYLNGQLAYYGETETRVSDAASLAQKFLTQEQTSLGQVQDANVPALAISLTQAQTQEQAALSVEAKIQQLPTLFSLLG